MRKTLSMIGLILLMLLLLDAGVARFLLWAEGQPRLQPAVRYFDYGYSVPGKLARWEARADLPGNLYDVAWRRAALEASAQAFAAEPATQGPVVRSYGMSFANNILLSAQALSGELALDLHAGPAAPPNYTFAQLLDDRANRRAGDVVVLGILSSSVPAMAALSNQTWAFEQPAPFTYPIFRPAGDDLRRIEPVIDSAAAHRALQQDTASASAWQQQLAAEDAFFSPVTHGAAWLDASPFARLIRRALATSHIRQVEDDILGAENYPYRAVLRRMITQMARTARADGQIPVVLLIQSRDPGDPDLLAIADPVLARHAIPYVATAEHADPRNPAHFVADGHYLPQIDRIFARAFLERLSSASP